MRACFAFAVLLLACDDQVCDGPSGSCAGGSLLPAIDAGFMDAGPVDAATQSDAGDGGL